MLAGQHENRRERPALRIRLPHERLPRVGAASARIAAVALLALIGLFHLFEAPAHFAAQPYVGVLFWLSIAGAWLAAIGIVVGARGAWLLGVVVAAACFAGLLLAISVGLPRFREDLTDSFAVPSLIVEGAFLVLYSLSSAARRDVAGT
jgi:hypothetical protein